MTEILLVGGASLLIWSGSEKLAAPIPVVDALEELIGGRVRFSPLLGRFIGASEIVVGVIVASGRAVSLRQAALYGVSALFVSVNIIGIMRKTEKPCGCFGARSNRPYGIVSLTIALVPALVAVFAGRLETEPMGAPTALALVGLAFLVHNPARLLARSASHLPTPES